MLKKYMVKWELQDRENQVEDQHDDESWRLGGVILPNEGVNVRTWHDARLFSIYA